MNISRRTARPSQLTTVVGLALAALSLSAQAQDANPNAASEGQWVPGRLLVQPRPGLSEGELDKILQPHGAKSVGKIEGIGVHILQLPPQASEKAVEALLKHNKHLKFVERDMIVMEHRFRAGERSLVSRLVAYGEPFGDSAMARTVSLPAAIAGRLRLEGSLEASGVLVPVLPEIYEPVLDEMASLGVAFEESEA